MLGRGDQLVAWPPGAEDVELHLDRGEVVSGGQVAEGLPGGDGIGERHPGAAVDQAAGMQVPLVYHDPSDRSLVADLERLDSEALGKARGDPAADRLRGHLGIRLAHD
jgi:hypothetical protein